MFGAGVVAGLLPVEEALSGVGKGVKGPFGGLCCCCCRRGRRVGKGSQTKDCIWCWWGSVGRERQGADEDGGRTGFFLLLQVSCRESASLS